MSYAEQNRKVALEIVKRLEGKGFKLCIPQRDLLGGCSYVKVTAELVMNRYEWGHSPSSLTSRLFTFHVSGWGNRIGHVCPFVCLSGFTGALCTARKVQSYLVGHRVAYMYMLDSRSSALIIDRKSVLNCYTWKEGKKANGHHKLRKGQDPVFSDALFLTGVRELSSLWQKNLHHHKSASSTMRFWCISPEVNLKIDSSNHTVRC